jgi:hypothetical protein
MMARRRRTNAASCLVVRVVKHDDASAAMKYFCADVSYYIYGASSPTMMIFKKNLLNMGGMLLSSSETRYRNGSQMQCMSSIDLLLMRAFQCIMMNDERHARPSLRESSGFC